MNVQIIISIVLIVYTIYENAAIMELSDNNINCIDFIHKLQNRLNFKNNMRI